MKSEKQNNVSFIKAYPWISSRELEKIESISSAPKIIIKIIQGFLETIEHVLGLEIGFRIPTQFLRYNFELWKEFDKIQTLQKHAIITHFEKAINYPDLPRIFRYIVSTHGSKYFGHNGIGVDFFSEKHALEKALGEAVERHAITHFLPEQRRSRLASYSEIGDNAINIFSLAGLSEEARKRKHSKWNLFFDRESPFTWVLGKSLTRKKKIWIPLQLVSFAHKAAHERKESLLLPPITTGAAAHPSLTTALINGLLEIIERDAFMITWVNALSPIIIDKKSVENEQLQEIFLKFQRYDIEAFFLYLPSDLPFHTILAVLIDHSSVGSAVSIGAKTSFEINTSLLGAATEACSVQLAVRGMRENKKKTGEPSLFRPNELTHETRMLWWAEKERIADISFLLKGPIKKISDLPKYPTDLTGDEKLRYIIDALNKKNLEAAYVEILNTDLSKKIGFSAVMTLIPGIQPLHLDESLPLFEGKRMETIPALFGFSHPIKKNSTPHPFP